ncbi:MAG TPA: chaperone modulator CbpM [Steroidobacteraceae bacterium]|nr:chaperone modulator CbpM [Steroidobacteraceae bacterium]
MATTDTRILVGQIVEEEVMLTLDELSCACAVERGRVVELIEHGLMDHSAEGDQLLGGDSLRRARIALRLQRDLEVNAAGAALVIELLERIEVLEARLRNR